MKEFLLNFVKLKINKRYYFIINLSKEIFLNNLLFYQAIEEANLTAEAQFISSQLNSKENQTDTPLEQLPQNNKRELETEEELEMKKKRRQEGLAMVNGEDSSINLDSLDDNNNNNSQSTSTSQNLPEISGDITETGREQTLANLAASISNKAIGGKLTLKNNTKNAPKKGYN